MKQQLDLPPVPADLTAELRNTANKMANRIDKMAKDHFKSLGRDATYNEMKDFKRAIIQAFNKAYRIDVFCLHAIELNIEFVHNPKLEMSDEDAIKLKSKNRK